MTMMMAGAFEEGKKNVSAPRSCIRLRQEADRRYDDGGCRVRVGGMLALAAAGKCWRQRLKEEEGQKKKKPRPEKPNAEEEEASRCRKQGPVPTTQGWLGVPSCQVSIVGVCRYDVRSSQKLKVTQGE